MKTDSVYDWRHGGRASDHEVEIGATTMNGHHSSSVDFGLFREEEPRPGGGSLVLVIENERELAEEIRLDLDSGGHAVQVAETLTEGLQAARSDDVGVLSSIGSWMARTGFRSLRLCAAKESGRRPWSSVGSRAAYSALG